jgi:hypothetical protein
MTALLKRTTTQISGRFAAIKQWLIKINHSDLAKKTSSGGFSALSYSSRDTTSLYASQRIACPFYQPVKYATVFM